MKPIVRIGLLQLAVHISLKFPDNEFISCGDSVNNFIDDYEFA